MHWGHRVSSMQPRLFQIDIKLSAWGVSIGTYLDKIVTNIPLCMGHTGILIEERSHWVITEISTVLMFEDINEAPNSSSNKYEHWYMWQFPGSSYKGKYPGFILFNERNINDGQEYKFPGSIITWVSWHPWSPANSKENIKALHHCRFMSVQL